MRTDYGSKVAGALKAIVQMHSDTSKMLVDCDKQIGKGRPSVFASYATRDLTYNFQAEFWMAEGVYRYYQASPSLVDGVTVAFFNASARTDPRFETEPLLLVARIQYSAAAAKIVGEDNPSGRGVCKEWDVWSLYFDWGTTRELGQVMTYERVDGGRIEWARLIAVPLFSVRRIDDVLQLMDRVLASAPDDASAAAAFSD